MTRKTLPSWQTELEKAAEKEKIKIIDLLLGYCILKGDIGPIRTLELEFEDWIDFYSSYVSIKPGLNKENSDGEVLQKKILERIEGLDVEAGKCYQAAKNIPERLPETSIEALKLKAVLLKKVAKQLRKE